MVIISWPGEDALVKFTHPSTQSISNKFPQRQATLVSGRLLEEASVSPIFFW